MAQETRVAPIEFSNTPTQVLMSIAEQGQQEALKRQQLEFERAKYARAAQEDEMKRRYENAQQFNTAIQNPNWLKETRDRFLSDIKNNANAKDVDSFEYRTNIGKLFGEMSQYNNLVKSVYTTAGEFVKNIPESGKQGFDANAFKNRFIQSALFNSDGSDKTYEQLQAENINDVANSVYQQNKSSLYDVATGHKQLTELIKSVPNSDISVAQRDKKGNVITGKSMTVKFNPELQEYDEKTGEVKLKSDEFGYIRDDVYGKFTSLPAVDASYTRKAEQFIRDYNASPKEAKLAIMGQAKFVDKNNDGIPDMLTAQDLDLVKKGFMTQDILRELPEIRKESESTTIINNNSIGGALGGGKGYMDAFGQLRDYVRSGRTGETPSNIANVIVDIANKQGMLGKLKGGNVQYVLGDVDIREDSDGRIRLYDKLTGSTEPMATLNPADFNVTYNKLFGKEAVEAATLTPTNPPAPPKQSIKRSDIPAKAKAAGYTTAEYEALLKEKGIKII